MSFITDMCKECPNEPICLMGCLKKDKIEKYINLKKKESRKTNEKTDSPRGV